MTQGQPSHILFDADIVTYRAGFASQTTTRDGTTDEALVTAEPVEYALGTAKSIINSTCRELGIYEYSMYLTESGIENNFRSQIQGNKQYKGNRKDFKKPIHYEAIREYLINIHKAKVIKGEEADDKLGIIQVKNRDKTVIASIDKDLLQIPGWHYNTKDKELIRVDDPGTLTLKKTKSATKPFRLIGTGFKWFCAQMLLGDAVDNVQGIKGFGDKTTHKLLSDINHPIELWKEIASIYASAGKTEDELIGTARLLWIRRKPGQIFDYDTVKELEEQYCGC